MSSELVAMLGGGITGFVMKFMSAQMEINSNALERMIAAQGASDESADRAAKRTEGGGVWVRRSIAITILFAVVIAPFIFAFYSIPVTIKSEGTGGIFSFLGFHADRWKSLEGFVLLPEIRQGMLAILGFYFGSSQVTIRR
jgi:hypothetical protein